MVTQMLNIREANFNFPMYSISASQSSVHIIGRVFQIAVRGGGLGEFFYRVVRTWGEVILTIGTFFKAKKSILWTLNIKIKINMSCVLKEYKIKTKMVQEQWLSKFLVGGGDRHPPLGKTLIGKFELIGKIMLYVVSQG